MIDKQDKILLKLERLEERINKLESSGKIQTPLNSHNSLDSLFDQAVIIISDYEKVSSALLQRRLSLGYARAARLLDQLEEAGLVGPAQGAKPRDVIKIPKETIEDKSFLSLLSETYNDGVIPYKWLLKMYESSKLNYKLPVILGINEAGKAQFIDLYKAPHIIIGGATDTGKTTFLYSLTTTLLYLYTPESLRLILVDFKRVEIPPIFQKLPHLLTDVITEPEKVISALKWTVGEMEHRYKKLAEKKVRNIEEYNNIINIEKIPFIVFIVDELADLMIFAPGEAEELIVRIAQMSRCTGIHLILSTQRPTGDVFTGLMKANIPTRIAFYTASKSDSKVIIDMPGAEKLRASGEILCCLLDTAKPIRIQTPRIEEDEMSAIIQYAIKSNKYVEKEYKEENEEVKSKKIFKGKKDKLLSQAIAIIQQQDRASASLIQRRLSIGYARAASILDQLESEGIVGPAHGAKPRIVIKTKS